MLFCESSKNFTEYLLDFMGISNKSPLKNSHLCARSHKLASNYDGGKQCAEALIYARFYSETIKEPLREAAEESAADERAGRNGACRGTERN